MNLQQTASRLGIRGEIKSVQRQVDWSLRAQTRAAARGVVLPNRVRYVYALRIGGEDTILGVSQHAAREALKRMAAPTTRLDEESA